MYEYKNGVWIARSEEEVKRQLSRRVQSTGKTPDPHQIDKAYKVIIRTGKSIKVEKFNSDEDLVCFRNGVYRLSDGAVFPHDPKYLFAIQLDARIPTTPSSPSEEPESSPSDPEKQSADTVATQTGSTAETETLEVEETPYCDLCLKTSEDRRFNIPFCKSSERPSRMCISLGSKKES